MNGRLVLGTAQLGMAYGINNRSGKPDLARAIGIIRTAFDGGIREFDTAQGYGDSEEVLGAALAQLGLTGQVRLVTKIDPAADRKDPKAIVQSVVRSLARLKVPSLEALMLHDESWLDTWGHGLGAAMGLMVRRGMARQVGVSVYSPQRAVQSLEQIDIGCVQVPSNILDRRFESAGVFSAAAEKRKTVYIRSVYLQGLLLMDPEALPAQMVFVTKTLRKIRSLAEKFSLGMDEMALGYALGQWPDARIVIGAETSEQVSRNLALAGCLLPLDIRKVIAMEFAEVDEQIIDPTRWRKRG